MPAITLMPHQKKLAELAEAGKLEFPFYLVWHMGSGKTYGACAAMRAATGRNGAPPRVLVLCDKSIEGQWSAAAARFFDGAGAGAPRVTVFRYQALNDGLKPAQYDMCVVDEAHRFRNAFRKDAQRANEYAKWIDVIMRNPRILYLSGTPLVSDLTEDFAAFRKMMREGDSPMAGRVSVYNPRQDKRKARYYATQRDRHIEVPMTWTQLLWYFLNKRNTFTIDVGGTQYSVQAHRPNAYNSALRRISNLPFPERPDESPKFRRIVSELQRGRDEGLKQLVYSSRRDTGVRALLEMWTKHTGVPKRAFLIDGSMDADDRTAAVNRFNKNTLANGGPPVLFVTDAAAQGVDLKGVGRVHLVEPSDCLAHEKQVINRAIRYRSHALGNQAVVDVYLYASTFPREQTLSTAEAGALQKLVEQQNVVHGERIPMRDIVRALQAQHVTRDAKGRTIDEETIVRRQIEADEIAKGNAAIEALDIGTGKKNQTEPPMEDAAEAPKKKTKKAATLAPPTPRDKARAKSVKPAPVDAEADRRRQEIAEALYGRLDPLAKERLLAIVRDIPVQGKDDLHGDFERKRRVPNMWKTDPEAEVEPTFEDLLAYVRGDVSASVAADVRGRLVEHTPFRDLVGPGTVAKEAHETFLAAQESCLVTEIAAPPGYRHMLETLGVDDEAVMKSIVAAMRYHRDTEKSDEAAAQVLAASALSSEAAQETAASTAALALS